MQDNTSWTPSADDNKLGLTEKAAINQYEARGIAAAEFFVFELDIDAKISAQLIREIHLLAFGDLYDWAGKWRTISVSVGQLSPPEPGQIAHLIHQFVDNLNFKIENFKISDSPVECLAFTH